MENDAPDTADVIALNGSLFAVVAGVMIPLKFCSEAKTCARKLFGTAPQTAAAMSTANGAAVPPRPATKAAAKAQGRLSKINDAAKAAANRFDEYAAVRKCFGLSLNLKRGDAEYDEARDRYMSASVGKM